MTNEDLTRMLEEATTEIAALQKRVHQLENSSSKTSLPDTMLLDKSFIKRAFAVYGHVFVAGLIIALPIYLIVFLAALAG